MERKIIYLDDAIDALRYAQHRFTVADEAGGMGTVKWSEDVIYFATAERVLAELPSAQPEIRRIESLHSCPNCTHWNDGVCDLDDDDATQSWVCSRNCTDMFEPRWEDGYEAGKAEEND